MKQKITMAYVEKFVAEHPDGKNIRGTLQRYTYFNRGSDETGRFDSPDEVRPGCVFGHIIASLGGGPKDVEEGASIAALNAVLSEELTDSEIDVLAYTQRAADTERLPWAAALEGAKSVNQLIS